MWQTSSIVVVTGGGVAATGRFGVAKSPSFSSSGCKTTAIVVEADDDNGEDWFVVVVVVGGGGDPCPVDVVVSAVPIRINRRPYKQEAFQSW